MDNPNRDQAISLKVTKSYFRASLGPNVAAAVAIGFSIGVLAAVLNTRAATEGTAVGEAVTVNVATNVAISWTIASIFCIPQIVSRAFTKLDYFIGCLQIVGWPARRYLVMLIAQLLFIEVLAILLSYPVAVLFQRLVMLISRRDSDDLLYPGQLFEPISLNSILMATLIITVSVIIVGIITFIGYALKQKTQASGAKPVRVSIDGLNRLRWGDLAATLPVVFLVIAVQAGAQAGLFVILAMVSALFWLCNRFILHIVRAIEKATTRLAGVIPGIAVLGAFSAELHNTAKSIVLPLSYVLGIPAIVLSVSHTEADALNQVGGGIQNWDFLVMLGLPLFFVGILSIASFLMAVDQVTITTDRLNKVGFPVSVIYLVRFAGLPFLFMCVSLGIAAIFALVSSIIHVIVLGSSIKFAIAGLSMMVSLLLAGALYLSFILFGLFYSLWKYLHHKYIADHRSRN